jgi:23S rRNA (guanosine2251-2'-O)-methyltransferase
MNSQITIGINAVSILVKRNPSVIDRLLVVTGKKNKRLAELIDFARIEKVRVIEVPKEELEAQARGVHQGVAAFVIKHAMTPAEACSAADLLEIVGKSKSELLLVLDSVTDPHNLGACLRTADAAGLRFVIIPKNNSASLNATARKVASGAAETVSLVTITNLARFLTDLKQLGFWIIGTDEKAPKSIYQHDFNGLVALVMGSEGNGLRRLTKEKCDFLASIPMAGDLSSLNVSVAAGVTLFEAIRQRSFDQE